MTILKPVAKKHRCDWPWVSDGYGSTGHEDGTLWQCPVCHIWWFSGPCYQSLGPTSIWYKVRWWHRSMLNRIKKGD